MSVFPSDLKAMYDRLAELGRREGEPPEDAENPGEILADQPGQVETINSLSCIFDYSTTKAKKGAA